MDKQGKIYALELNGSPKFVGHTEASLGFKLCQLRAQKGKAPLLKWIQALPDRFALSITELEICSKEESRKAVRWWVTGLLAEGHELFNGNCRKRVHRGTGTPIAEFPTYIYVLQHPLTGEVRYVGKTVDLSDRKKGHRIEGRTRCDAWKRSLRREDLEPVLEVIETVPVGANWVDRERYWIHYYRQNGARLTNLTDGGEGTQGRNITDEYREKLSRAFKGRPIPQEQREQISKTLTGKKQTPETVQKRLETINVRRLEKGLNGHNIHASKEAAREHSRTQSMLRRRVKRRAEGKLEMGSPEWKAILAEKGRQQWAAMTDEQKEAVRAARRGQPSVTKGMKFGPQSEERRKHQSERLKAYIASLTPEQREARMTAARAGRKAKLGY
jgi:hypothetical protein